MQTVRIVNTTKGTVIGERIDIADTSLTRMKGLLGRDSLEPGTGLLIIPSQAVHTFAMRFAIDLLFVDKHFRVIHAQPSLVPYRLSGLHWKARGVIELPVGSINQSVTTVGDELEIED